MEKLEQRKKTNTNKVDKLNQSKLQVVPPPIELKQYQKFLKALKKLIKSSDADAKAKIIKPLIHRIDVGKDDVVITYKLDQSSLLREPIHLGSGISFDPKSKEILRVAQKDVVGSDLGRKKSGKNKSSAATKSISQFRVFSL